MLRRRPENDILGDYFGIRFLYSFSFEKESRELEMVEGSKKKKTNKQHCLDLIG
jgi:hypothetical protein